VAPVKATLAVATPLLTAELASWFVPSKKATVPVGAAAPELCGLIVAVSRSAAPELGVVEPAVSPVEVPINALSLTTSETVADVHVTKLETQLTVIGYVPTAAGAVSGMLTVATEEVVGGMVPLSVLPFNVAVIDPAGCPFTAVIVEVSVVEDPGSTVLSDSVAVSVAVVAIVTASVL
jgi:hypothetical protein